jgi:hypothetical protein
MPDVLESGKLRLTPNEAATYRAAAERLGEACEIRLDLTRPISSEDWILIRIAHAALARDLGPLDEAMAMVESALRVRAHN